MKRKSYTDALTTLAKGTDAGLYRLIPERVEIVNSEEEVQEILAECRVIGKPLTFKAGGTSLSGQTITDSVLVEIGPDFGKIKISEDGRSATFPCGITGDHANRLLKRYGRKLGPSPASIKSARISGIVANNASGSSYGITYNSYHTVRVCVCPDGRNFARYRFGRKRRYFGSRAIPNGWTVCLHSGKG